MVEPNSFISTLLCASLLVVLAGLKPRDIDILVVNCSLFNPTPSLSAMIVNHFKMRSDVLSYNLAGTLNSAHHGLSSILVLLIL